MGRTSRLEQGSQGTGCRQAQKARHTLWIDRVSVGAEGLEQDSAGHSRQRRIRAVEEGCDSTGNRQAWPLCPRTSVPAGQQAGELEWMGCTLAVGQGCGSKFT